MVPGVRGEPLGDSGVRMGPVVVQDEMDLSTTGNFAIHLLHECQELLMAVAGLTAPDHGALEHVQDREQGRRAVTHVVMGPCLRVPGPHGQRRLRAVQSLKLALLVDT